MTVEIKIYGERASEALHELRQMSEGLFGNPEASPVEANQGTAVVEDNSSAPNLSDTSGDDSKQPEQTQEPRRERGKPAPGKSRRTKAEIEEDEAAEAAEAAAAAAAKAGEKPGISTGEERTDTDNPEDAKDEEADPVNQSGGPASRDDVRELMIAYSTMKGMPALNADMGEVLAALFKDGSVTKLSEIPEDPEAFAAVIDALTAKLEA